jgi:hypothetical protein
MADETPDPWAQLPEEPRLAYKRFLAYMGLGPARSIKATVEALGGRPGDRNLRNLASKYNWKKRADAYDLADMRAHLEARAEAREVARQVLVRGAAAAAKTILDIGTNGTMPEGDSLEAFTRSGKSRGRISVVKPSTRIQACRMVLEHAGITVPKRIELSGPDGTEIKLAAMTALTTLTDAQLAALAAAFPGGGDATDA